MQTASFGAFPGPSGDIFVNVRKGDRGVPLIQLLPSSAQGDGFGAFPCARYFDFVQLCLITSAQWDTFLGTKDIRSGRADGPIRVSPPGFDLDAYALVNANNELDYARLTQLIAVVGKFWDHEPLISPQPGLLHGLYTSGMPLEIMAETLIQVADLGGLTPDGRLVFQPVEPNRDKKIMLAVVSVYNQQRGRDAQAVVPLAEMEPLIKRWDRATRSLPMNAKGFDNPVLMWADYRRLGLIDPAGREDLSAVQQLANHILGTEDAPGFAEVVAWQDRHASGQATNGQPRKNASEQLLSKRKQGRLNRKRGRH